MFASRNLQKHCFKTLSSLMLNNPFKNALLPSDVPLKLMSSNAIQTSFPTKDVSLCSTKIFNCFEGSRAMSTEKGRSMRSKVESRMRKESGKTLREIRRAKKLRKKLMTDEERLVYNLRRALFKARFEQALESQKLNIKKLEQQLRRMGVNPDDPVAMASIRRVASTFFNAIDKKDGSPYVFREDKQSEIEPSRNLRRSEPGEDSDQEELDRFIAEIEDAADKEWAEEEAAEKEELGKIRYWSRDDLGGRFRRSELLRSEDSVDATRGGGRSWKDAQSGRRRSDDSDDEGDEEWDSNGVGDVSDYESDTVDHDRARLKHQE
ncbi:hypothetical protein LOK49_LG01G04085 [Camellia lanceoleosa]|uniref:Uncharacterized protein n=1 Tax=Camellia lanceoleosa TaxID=1840588 RepID=A0ACC0J374_9ERIC|nr:hypothetical protein LOK49_LG01G04085 [Camellia lanceoleosa]